jgi:hypothetical protein
MTKLIQENFEQILQLFEEQQDTLATYLQKHLIELLEKLEKKKHITEQKNMIDNFNQGKV